MRKMRVAILGCGQHANAHALMVRRSDFAELTACADIHLEKAKIFAERYDIPKSYGSLQDMVRNESIDLMYIVAFPTVHPSLVKEAISLGVKYIICEKPLAMSAMEVKEVYQVAKDQKAMVIEGLMYRNHPQFDKTRELIDQGAIGEVKYIHAQFSATPVEQPGNWRNNRKLGGSSLSAKGCYLIDACNVFSRSQAVKAFAYETIDPHYDVEIGFTGTLIYKSGVAAQLESNHRSVGREIISVYGTEGSIVIPYAIAANDLSRYIELHVDDKHQTVRYEFKPANGYYLQLMNAYQCIFHGALPTVSLEDTLENYIVTDALKASTRSGRLEDVNRDK